MSLDAILYSLVIYFFVCLHAKESLSAQNGSLILCFPIYVHSSPRALFENIRHYLQSSILTDCFLGANYLLWLLLPWWEFLENSLRNIWPPRNINKAIAKKRSMSEYTKSTKEFPLLISQKEKINKIKAAKWNTSETAWVSREIEFPEYSFAEKSILDSYFLLLWLKLYNSRFYNTGGCGLESHVGLRIFLCPLVVDSLYLSLLYNLSGLGWLKSSSYILWNFIFHVLYFSQNVHVVILWRSHKGYALRNLP